MKRLVLLLLLMAVASSALPGCAGKTKSYSEPQATVLGGCPEASEDLLNVPTSKPGPLVPGYAKGAR